MLKILFPHKKWYRNFTIGINYLIPLFKFKKFPSNEEIVFYKNP